MNQGKETIMRKNTKKNRQYTRKGKGTNESFK